MGRRTREKEIPSFRSKKERRKLLLLKKNKKRGPITSPKKKGAKAEPFFLGGVQKGGEKKYAFITALPAREGNVPHLGIPFCPIFIRMGPKREGEKKETIIRFDTDRIRPSLTLPRKVPRREGPPPLETRSSPRRGICQLLSASPALAKKTHSQPLETGSSKGGRKVPPRKWSRSKPRSFASEK